MGMAFLSGLLKHISIVSGDFDVKSKAVLIKSLKTWTIIVLDQTDLHPP